MNYSLNCGPWNHVFAVPAEIVDEHLRMCGASQLKSLLYLLRHAGEPIELLQIASALGLTPGDTQDALNYWVERGLLRHLSGLDSPVSAAPAPVLSPVPAVEPAGSGDDHPLAVPPASKNPPPRQSRLGVAEVQQIATSKPELKELLAEAEALLGKMLTSADVSTLASLYDWAGIPADLLLTVMGYCKTLGKTNLRYIERVALNWQEQGIETMEQAERYMRETLELDTQVRLVKSAFGLHDRALTARERDYVKQWFGEYRLGVPLIKLAYERTVERTGKVSFAYTGKILSDWHAKGIRTPEQAARADETFARQKASAQSGQSSFDIDEIEQYLSHNPPKL